MNRNVFSSFLVTMFPGLCFVAWTLLLGWQERHLACKMSAAIIPGWSGPGVARLKKAGEWDSESCSIVSDVGEGAWLYTVNFCCHVSFGVLQWVYRRAGLRMVWGVPRPTHEPRGTVLCHPKRLFWWHSRCPVAIRWPSSLPRWCQRLTSLFPTLLT